jgi:hypothetical protein
MTPRFGIPAVLLCAASVGWAVCPPRPATDHNTTDLAVRQLHDDGSVAPALRDRHRGGWPTDIIPPVACVILGVAAVAAGVRDAYRLRTKEGGR